MLTQSFIRKFFLIESTILTPRNQQSGIRRRKVIS